MISIAYLDDTDEIMEFIDKEWKKGHILSKNKDFFLYEYSNKDALNFIISKRDGVINGILGFLKSSSDINSTVWTTMWKVSKSNGSEAANSIASIFLSFLEIELGNLIIFAFFFFIYFF